MKIIEKILSSNADQVRKEQAEAARLMVDDDEPVVRRTLSAPRGQEWRSTTTTTTPAPRRASSPPQRVPLKGHEAFLKALELSGADVVIEKVSTGVQVHGRLKHSDKYTVTLRTTDINGDTIDRVIYKHDISEFFTTTPRPDVTLAAAAEQGSSV